MNLKQFTGYCYDEITKELGFVRYLNGYYKVTDRAVASFFLEQYRGRRLVRPLMEIFPLCGIIPTSEDTFGTKQIESAYWRHTHTQPELAFSTRKTQEEIDNVQEILIDIFRVSEQPFLTCVFDLQSGFDAYCAYQDYHFEFTPIKNEFWTSPNYWCFLLALKRYDAALQNFNAWAERVHQEYLSENGVNGMGGIMHRLLTDKRYEQIDAIMQKREEENLALLKRYHVL